MIPTEGKLDCFRQAPMNAIEKAKEAAVEEGEAE